MDRKHRRAKVMESRLRLGQFVTERRGAQFEEVWQDGYAFTEINKKLKQINLEKEEIARSSQLLRKRKPSTVGLSASKKQQSQSSTNLAAAVGVVQLNSNSNDGFARPDPPKEYSFSLVGGWKRDETSGCLHLGSPLKNITSKTRYIDCGRSS